MPRHQKQTIEDMHKLAAERGFRCLSEHYINSRTHLTWECNNGHTWEAKPSVIQQGSGCPHCSGRGVKGPPPAPISEQEQLSAADTAWFDQQLILAKTSLRAIARRYGIDEASNLSRMIRGKMPLNLTFAIILADTFHVPIEEIIKRSGFKLPRRRPVKTESRDAALISQSRIKKLRKPQS